jgi:hypothetical protein
MGMITKDRYVKGTHNAVSDLSGQKYKRCDMRLTWDNLLVGKDEWEPKHPQLILRPRPDRPAITNQTRTQSADPALELSAYDPAGGV